MAQMNILKTDSRGNAGIGNPAYVGRVSYPAIDPFR
jgi:hypothetical protein